MDARRKKAALDCLHDFFEAQFQSEMREVETRWTLGALMWAKALTASKLRDLRFIADSTIFEGDEMVMILQLLDHYRGEGMSVPNVQSLNQCPVIEPGCGVVSQEVE